MIKELLTYHGLNYPEENVQQYKKNIWTRLCQGGEKAGRHRTEDSSTQESFSFYIEMQGNWNYPTKPQSEVPH